jgi:transcription initiation factor IIE alpha subunit
MPVTLKPREKRILRVLLEHNHSLTTTQIANLARISWNTAKKYLIAFYQKGWIVMKPAGNRTYWRAYRR